MGWDGMGWDGMGWDGMGWDGRQPPVGLMMREREDWIGLEWIEDWIWLKIGLDYNDHRPPVGLMVRERGEREWKAGSESIHNYDMRKLREMSHTREMSAVSSIYLYLKETAGGLLQRRLHSECWRFCKQAASLFALSVTLKREWEFFDAA
jgi:hypothetical protein